MPKRLGKEIIYIAPNIAGNIDEQGSANVYDEISGEKLDPANSFDKIRIYERQVNGWFLDQADKLLRRNNQNKGFVVLMICLSYFEGVEQYKMGRFSNGRSEEYFKKSIERVYPGQFDDPQLKELYTEGRCGLFHNGMVRGQVVIRNSFPNSIEFQENRIKISPSKLLRDIKIDFEAFIKLLREDETARNNFNDLYTNL